MKRVPGARRRVALLLGAALLGMVPAAAAGQPRPQRVVLLPTLAEGDHAGKGTTWDGQLAELLASRSLELMAPPLTADDLKCQKLDCLEKIRKRLKADLALRVRVVGAAFGFKLKLWVVSEGTQHSSEEESDCSQCSVETARARLEEVVGKWLPGGSTMRGLDATPAAGSPAPVVTAAATTTATATTTTTGTGASQAPGWLLPAEIALAAGIALGTAGVAYGIYCATQDGQPACQMPIGATRCPNTVNGALSGGVYIGVGGAILIGSVTALTLIELKYRRPEKTQPVTLAPVVWSGGAALVAGGAF